LQEERQLVHQEATGSVSQTTAGLARRAVSILLILRGDPGVLGQREGGAARPTPSSEEAKAASLR